MRRIFGETSLPTEPEGEVASDELSGFVNADGKIVLVGDDLSMSGYQLESSEGLLVPIPTATSVSPFQFILSNTSNLVSIGNVSVGATIDGQVVTPVGYRGASPQTELIGSWGIFGDSTLHSFVVTRDSVSCDPTAGGDLDGDGTVGFTDFLIFSNNFGQSGLSGASHLLGDLDCNGNVDFPDFLSFSAAFGTTVGAPATVPEPSGVAQLIAASLLCLLIRRHVA